MPVKRRMAKRVAADVASVEWAYLTDDPGLAAVCVRGTSFYVCDYDVLPRAMLPPRLKDLWELHGQEITEDWSDAYPGTRPKCWWAWEAPRAHDNPSLPSPRLQVGGSGIPARFSDLHGNKHLHLRVRYGLPTEWLEQPRGDAPPIYESEAAYLLRHGLFLAGERAHVRPAAFKPVVVAVGPPEWSMGFLGRPE